MDEATAGLGAQPRSGPPEDQIRSPRFGGSELSRNLVDLASSASQRFLDCGKDLLIEMHVDCAHVLLDLAWIAHSDERDGHVWLAQTHAMASSGKVTPPAAATSRRR